MGKRLLEFLRPARVFLATIDVFLVGGAILLLHYGYRDSFLLLNCARGGPVFDQAMYYLTQLGDGGIMAALLLFFGLRRNAPMAFTAVAAVILTGLFVQLLKNLAFSDWERPVKALADIAEVFVVSDQTPRYKSFPSGHSITAMTGLFFAAQFVSGRRDYWQIALALGAVFIGWSRAYVGAHFFGDVYASWWLGLILSPLVYWAFYSRIERLWGRIPEENQRKTVSILRVLSVLLFAGVCWGRFG